MTPPGLLLNTLSVHRASVCVGLVSFIAPDSGIASHRGGIEKKRVCLCVAAHIFPIWSSVLRGYFKDNPVNRIALAKQSHGTDEALANADGRRDRRSTLRTVSRKAAAEKGSNDKKEDGGEEPPPSGQLNVPDSTGDDRPLPVIVECISKLAQVAATCSINCLLILHPSPVLPSSAVVSVLSVPAPEDEDACRADDELRVVLPRKLIKRTFRLLSAVNETDGALDLAGHASPGAPGAPSTSPVLCISVGKNLMMRCSTAGLTYMSSVLALNEQLKLCADFLSWIQKVRQSTAVFPWQLEFLIGAQLPVAAATDFI